MTEVPENHTCSRWESFLIVVRGVLMGGADAIPGVSGGTVALIVGIYARLVTAISHIDLQFLGYLRKRQWSEACRHMDLFFLLKLGTGISVGLVSMAVMMSVLLKGQFRSLTLAAFFGMILASGILVVGMIRQMRQGQPILLITLGLIGAAFSCWLSTLGYTADGATNPSYLFLFLCGCLAICAMILPGISGAMILLILGPYEYVLGTIKQLVQFENVGSGILTLAAFGSGCAISLILFSKVLRKLLERFTAQTTALLCGFMFGALLKLWPFQNKIGDHEEYEPFMPQTFDSSVWAAIGIAMAAMAFVFMVDRLSRNHENSAFSKVASKPSCEHAIGR
jgi:putative membrane protein